jgi:hypothetical protein
MEQEPVLLDAGMTAFMVAKSQEGHLEVVAAEEARAERDIHGSTAVLWAWLRERAPARPCPSRSARSK